MRKLAAAALGSILLAMGLMASPALAGTPPSVSPAHTAGAAVTCSPSQETIFNNMGYDAYVVSLSDPLTFGGDYTLFCGYGSNGDATFYASGTSYCWALNNTDDDVDFETSCDHTYNQWNEVNTGGNLFELRSHFNGDCIWGSGDDSTAAIDPCNSGSAGDKFTISSVG
jgi:hypothetical protein